MGNFGAGYLIQAVWIPKEANDYVNSLKSISPIHHSDYCIIYVNVIVFLIFNNAVIAAGQLWSHCAVQNET